MSDLVLVTGGAGFIGSHLVRALLKRGDRVRVLDDFSTGRRERLDDLGLAADGAPEPRLEILRGDVRHAGACEAAVAGCSAVLHQAAVVSVPRSMRHPAETAAVNLVGTARLLDACERAGVARFVLASTCAIYGASRRGCSEDAPPEPASPYASSKLAAEHQVFLAARRGLRGLALRYFNVVGVGQDADSGYAAVVPAFVSRAVAGRPIVVHGDGTQTRDFVHVDDVVAANLAALDAPSEAMGRVFNVGTGSSISIRDLATRIAGLASSQAPIAHEGARPGDIARSTADVSRTRRLLGWRARRSLDEALRELIAAAGT